MLDNAGLGFGLKYTRLVVTGQHFLVPEILKEKHTVRHLIKLTVTELNLNEILLTFAI